MRRVGHQPASIFKLNLFFFLAFSMFSFSLLASAKQVRVLTVKIAAPLAFKSSEIWKVEMHKMIRDASMRLKSWFGIAFKVTDVEYWNPGVRSRPLVDHLRDLVKKVPRGECHLVIGIVSSSIPEKPPFGAADYLHAYVVIRDHPVKSGLANVLEHEICHIFGAIDLEENGSIMDVTHRGGRYDDFTTRIVTINRNRSFAAGQFPLPPDLIDKAIGLYWERLGRHGRATDSRKVEARELQIVLNHLYQEKFMQAMLNHALPPANEK